MTKLEKQTIQRKTRRDKGLCIYCGKEAIKGKSYCVTHWLQNIKSAKKSHFENRQKRLLYYKKNRLKKMAEGRCPKCGVTKNHEADGDSLYCSNCQAGIHKHYYS